MVTSIMENEISIRIVLLDSPTNAYTNANLENFVPSFVLTHTRDFLFSFHKFEIKNPNIVHIFRFGKRKQKGVKI